MGANHGKDAFDEESVNDNAYKKEGEIDDEYYDDKDKVLFVSPEDDQKPLHPDVAALSVTVDDDDDNGSGPILPNGEINWQCPCMGGMVAGPCGIPFREAFSCFHYSKSDPKGADCIEKFREMSLCMSHYPNLYPRSEEGDDTDDDDDEPDLVAEAMQDSEIAESGRSGGRPTNVIDKIK